LDACLLPLQHDGLRRLGNDDHDHHDHDLRVAVR
jgi:hypothetical protein